MNWWKGMKQNLVAGTGIAIQKDQRRTTAIQDMLTFGCP